MKGFKRSHYQVGEFKYLPYQIVENAIGGGWERSLVVLLKVRGIYKKPVIYDYSEEKLAKLIGLSRPTIHKHIGILIKHKLVAINNGHLYATGTNKILLDNGWKKQSLVPVKLSSNSAEQLQLIRAVVILRNLSYQEKAFSKKTEILKLQKGVVMTPGQIKKLEKSDDGFRERSGLSTEMSRRDVLSLSNGKFGKLIKMSKESGQKLQRDMRSMGLIQVKSTFRKISARPVGFSGTGVLDRGYLVNKKDGYLYRQLPNSISICN